jgi:hypothetical protein
VSAFVLAVGFCAFWGQGSRPAPARPLAETKAFLLAAVPFGVWILYRATLPPACYDSGLYHFNTIRWITSYPIVPGLGNLHGRLAFNQSYFLFPALLNVAPFFQHGHNIANPLLLSVAVGQFLWAAVELWSRRQPTPALIFQTAALPANLYYAARSHFISSPTPDLVIYILAVVLTSELVLLLFPAFAGGRLEGRVVFLLTLAVAAVTFKLSIAAFSFVLCAIVLRFYLRAEAIPAKSKRAAIGFVSVAVLVLIGPWMARGVVTSGYPLYPSNFAPLAVDWRIPSAKTRRMRREIIAWGRAPGVNSDSAMNLVLADSKWLRPWLKSLVREKDIIQPVRMTLLLPVAVGLLWRTRKFQAAWLLPMAPGACWVIYWFLSAPDPRFVGPAFWILSLWTLTLLALAVGSLRRGRQPSPGGPQVAPAPGCGVSARAEAKCAASDGEVSPLFCRAIAIAAILLALCCLTKIPPALDRRQDGFCAIPQPPLRIWRTPSKLGVILAVSGDQTWDAPLPAADLEPSDLELRGATLRSGFRVRPTEALAPPR